ncbi:cAMP-dependent protein kinase type 2 [Uncinocarpus reesii 1704]|uniref:cAMP-dependent protein kinase n=1 Tax=Uncinocarpus reesii (strain UAMH 1704) TaxID=336963 RepID=C4JXF5_UNCRE|nr:cAMP-dependent protein kinase type 2 [Uncinocarpus reesii 1704]EEP81463.1 cAMP-dependent protein kinase type 2 [Uncinocarpus reesii 1704]
MPTFGGLLKKRRTKESRGSKDLQSTASSGTDSASDPSASSQVSSPQRVRPSTPLTTSTCPPAAAPPKRPIDAGTSNATQPDPAPFATPDVRAGATGESTLRPQMNSQHLQHPSSPLPGASPQPLSPQHHQNVASIKNIINPPQHEDGVPHDGHFVSQQPIRTAQRQLKGKYSLNDFTLRRTLGTGSFGRVHLVQSVHNQRYYAIKVLKKQQVVKMKQVEHTNDERRMLERVKHPFLITLWGTFQDAKNLYMVMDFVEGGELFSLLRKSQRFPNPVAKFYAAEVTLALEYLHSQNIVYRDLKPENLLLDRHGHLKITDFGFAKEVRDITWTLCGTPDYLAPEVVSSKGYNKSVDWWSLGILIFEMLCGFTPFWDSGSPMKIYENIVHGRVKYPPFLVPDARDLLSQLITPDLTKRLGNLRGGPEDVKNHAWFSEVTWDRLARKDIDAPYIPPVKAGQGDASQFDTYPEETEQYGLPANDEFGHLFQEF